MRYRVKWTKTTTVEGYVNDGDQDGDAWEGTRAQAIALTREMRSRDKRSGYRYSAVPSPYEHDETTKGTGHA